MHIWIIKKNTIIRFFLFFLLIGITFVYTNSIFKKNTSVSAEKGTEMPIMRIESEDMVAITFDTTFGDDYTAEILKVLEENEINATFFVMGAWATKYPASLKLISLSNSEIASHSMSHERYTDLPARDMIADADACKDYLYKTCDVQTNIIRMPYGSFDDDTLFTLRGEGFVPVKWNLDSKDWKMIDSGKIISNINQKAKPGDIILFQNNSEQTAIALDTVIKDLKNKGLKPVTLTEMIPAGKVYVDTNGTLKIMD
jgi:peptidoglycan-N-acetylglucosamine deacetylase